MPPRRPSRSGADASAWRTVEPSPVVLLLGSEEYFVASARRRLLARARELRGEIEVHEISAKDYVPGSLVQATSPSLFGDNRVVVVSELAGMSEEFLDEATAYLKQPDAESMVLMHHTGGNRGKKLLDGIRAGGHPVVECKPLKNDRDKTDFLYTAFRDAGRRIEPDAARMLVAAAGQDVSELASAAHQLIADGPPTVTDALVEKYYGGRVEVTAFKVADAAVSGHSAFALRALRQALDSGVDPVPLVGALATRVRTIARVHGRRETPGGLAKALGMQAWQIEQAQRDARKYSSEDLSAAIRSLAEADAQIKGESQDPVYALEKAVLVLSASGSRR